MSPKKTVQPQESSFLSPFIQSIDFEAILQESKKLYTSQYFEYVVFLSVVLLSFLMGRLFHEKRFSNLINMVNDAENTRKNLQKQLTQTRDSIKKMQEKKYLAVGVLIVLVMAMGFYTYHMANRVDVALLMNLVIIVGAVCLCLYLRLRYLKWKHESLDKKYRSSALTTQTEVKEILSEIGPLIADNLKYRFSMQIDQDKRKEQQKGCEVIKCHNEKRAYEKLNTLYREMIAEMTKFNWCEICSLLENVNILDLKMNEFKGNLAMYNKLIHDEKFAQKLDKQKELINRMLEDWSHMQPMLDYVCRRGCCVRFRELTETLKKRHYNCLNQLKNSLRD